MGLPEAYPCLLQRAVQAGVTEERPVNTVEAGELRESPVKEDR
jgi:hypothetical protein